MLNLRPGKNRQKLLRLVAASAFLLFVSLINAQAQLSFADFVQQDGTQRNFSFTNNVTSGSLDHITPAGETITGNPILFRYVGVTLPLGNYPTGLRGFQDAHLTISATTTTTGTDNSGNVSQPISGLTTILITRDTPYNGGTVLLRVEIASTGAGLPASGPYPAQPASSTTIEMGGTSGGDSPTFGGSTPGQSVRFSSDFVDFTQTNTRAFSIGMSGLSAPFSLDANGFLQTLAGSGNGSFSSDPRPFYNPPTAAAVNIGGRVVNTVGNGVRRAQVTLTNADGSTRIITTNSFGYYNFDGVNAGQTVIVSVSAKRYIFSPRIVSVSSDLTNLDFTAQ